MEYELLDVDFDAKLRALQAQRSASRSAGRHLSHVIHHILERYDKKRFGGREIDPVLAHGGFVWEDVMSRAFAGTFGNDQIEVQDEETGLFMTLDGFSAKRWRVIEYKMTKISARNDIRSSKFWHWHMQIMAYCRYMRTREAELLPMFVNGSYELAGGRLGKPVLGQGGRAFVMKYTDREVEENWDMLKRENDDMDREAA